MRWLQVQKAREEYAEAKAAVDTRRKRLLEDAESPAKKRQRTEE